MLRAAQPGQIVPVDSEHSALAQCLRGGTPDEVAKLVLTASGGPFRGWSAADLEHVTPEQAGAHPTWSMGPMNTLNSASLVNKGLELIETHLLFGIRLRPHRGRRAPAVDYSFDGHLHRRVDDRPGQPAGHEAADFAGVGLAAAGARCGRLLRLQHGFYLGIRAAGRRRFPRGRAGPARRRDRRLHDRGIQRRERRSGGSLPRQAASDSPSIVATIADVLHAADQWAAAPATVDDVLEAQRWARERAQRAIATASSAPVSVRSLRLGVRKVVTD